MAKRRSPNYPSLNLEDAIERVTRVYREEHTHAAAKLAVAGDLGYSSLSGRALGQLGALRAYGLLEGRGDALRVSDHTVAIIEFAGEPDNPRRLRAMRESAFAPTIFHDMFEQFGQRPPSDAAMRHWLIERDFLSNAANEVIQIYRDNLDFLQQAGVSYTDSNEESRAPAGATEPTVEPQPKIDLGDQMNPSDSIQVRMEGARPGLRQDVFSLSEGTVTIQWPAALSPESLQDVSDWLEIVKRKIGRSVVKDEPE